MAIVKVVGGDTLDDYATKYNNTVDKLVTGATSSNGLVSLTLFDGSTISINIPFSKNEVISGGEVTINPADFLEVTVAPVIYVTNGTNYAVAVPTVLNLTAGDVTNPRIDVIYANTSGVVAKIDGTPSATPTAPTLTNTQTFIAYVYVEANADSLGGTSLPLFSLQSTGTPNNTVRFDANGSLVETDSITTNGTDVDIQGGLVTVSGSDFASTLSGDFTVNATNGFTVITSGVGSVEADNLDLVGTTQVRVSAPLFDIQSLAKMDKGQMINLATKSANYTILDTDFLIRVDTASVTITLPTAVSKEGQKFVIANVSGGTITLNTTSSQTIYLVETDVDTSINLLTGEQLTVVSDGSNYMIIGG